jgi:polysaccharide biosynthesis protein PslH
LNILLISNKLPYPPNDGGAIATMNMALGLAAAGNRVVLLALNTSKHYFSLNDIPKSISSRVEFLATDVDTTIKPLKALKNLLFSSLPYNAERFISGDFRAHLSMVLRNTDFDVVQVEGLYMLAYLPDIKANSSAKIVYRAHNIEHEIWERMVVTEGNIAKRAYLKILSKRIMRLERETINAYDALVPITVKDADFFKAIGNIKPLLVAPAGIDFSQTKVKVGVEFNNSVFFIGALDWLPNQEGLLWFMKHVWDKVNTAIPDACFFIAGRNAPASLVEKIKGKNVIYLGEIADSGQYMQDKMIMAVPLFSGSGMRVKIIEGMALGKAIVSTSVGAEGLGSHDQKDILIAGTPEGFADAIVRLLNDKNFYRSISNGASAFCSEKFNNLAITKNLVDFYNKMLFHVG